MSLFSELQGAFDELTEAGGQVVTIDGKDYKAAVSAVATGSEFLPGVELETAQLVARISRTELADPPARQSRLTYAGTVYRVETVTPNPTSFLLGLTSLKN